MEAFLQRNPSPTTLPSVLQAARQQSKPCSVEMLHKATPQINPLASLYLQLSRKSPQDLWKKTVYGGSFFYCNYQRMQSKPGSWLQIPVPQNSLCDLGQALQHHCSPNPTVKGEQCYCTSTKYYGDKCINDYEAFREDNMAYQEANSIATNQYYYWCQNQILFLISVLQHYLGTQPRNILPRIIHISQRNSA